MSYDLDRWNYMLGSDGGIYPAALAPDEERSVPMSAKPESVVRAAVLAIVPGAQYLNLSNADGGHAIDDPCGDRYLTFGAPSRRAAWRRALRFLKESKP